ncbi:hypothetical protein CS063_13910 [Sporanaerobium hydrogeniformans]|uniref:Uncharacterized protein n=1 Tax=Sporanaerobium hydrogeniformans TaxID=3072179 RepID=A0AC61DAP9_9FIRM|nr:phosphatase PAP2 family protein [Sporanaerobium hydrogeniformans]PHV69806.1 hypothetical protein CS063_13910 [Sporanaerobium hydrogeniformans]
MSWQVEVLQYLESIRTDFLTMLLTTITILAEKYFMIMVIALLYWCVDKIKSIRLAWFVLIGASITGVIKNSVRMPRPFQTGVVMPIRAETATSYSFPSGHTGVATSFWGGSMFIFKSPAMVVIGLTFIILTGFSRIYLGVHWPIDVLGAFLFGAISVYLADVLLGEKAIMTRWHVIGVSLFTCLIMLLPIDGDLYKITAALWGTTLGVYIEQNFINFEPKQKTNYQVIKIIVGIIGILFIYGGLKKVLPDQKLFHMLRYATVLLWISAGAPYVFKKYLSKKKA